MQTVITGLLLFRCTIVQICWMRRVLRSQSAIVQYLLLPKTGYYGTKVYILHESWRQNVVNGQYKPHRVFICRLNTHAATGTCCCLMAKWKVFEFESYLFLYGLPRVNPVVVRNGRAHYFFAKRCKYAISTTVIRCCMLSVCDASVLWQNGWS